MKKIYKETKKNHIKSISLLFLCIIVLLTIGYSSYSTELSIGRLAAIVRVQRDVRITGVSVTGNAGSAISNYEEYNVKNFYTGISLPNSNSTVTYNVKVTNIGNTEAGIIDITGLPSNLKYTLNNYGLNGMMCDDTNNSLCKLGSTTTISITIGYADNGYDSSNTDYAIDLSFEFAYLSDVVARIGYNLFDTLDDAVKSVTNNTQTTIVLLKNTSESVSIPSNRNIVIDLNGKTVSNNGNKTVFINGGGNLTLLNGIITSNASSKAAVDNNAGNLIIDGTRITTSGGRHCLYNIATATIRGSAYLESSTVNRATITNDYAGGGTLNIESGTIISTGNVGVKNANTMTIGIKDGVVDDNNPQIIGITNGVSSTSNFNFYDGIFKGTVKAVSDDTKIADIEVDNYLLMGDEDIGNDNYNTLYLGIPVVVTFDANGGSVYKNTISSNYGFANKGTRNIGSGKNVGSLPIPERSKYTFLGWFTSASENSREINKNEIIYQDTTFYAHWQRNTDVARIGSKYYDSIYDAVNDVPSNTQTTIYLEKNIYENVVINDSTRDIILDLGNKTMRNAGNFAVIEFGAGKLKITNGTISCDANIAAINQSGGELVIEDAQIIGAGTRQAIYISGGQAEIKGNSYLKSTTSGKATSTSVERGTASCLSGCTLIITGGTIENLYRHPVANEGTVIMGVKDGNISTSSPVLLGKSHGIRTIGTFKFYDGIIKAVTTIIDGTITEIEDNTHTKTGNETIGGQTFKTLCLEHD